MAVLRVYVRVSSAGQKTDSQMADLERYAEQKESEGWKVQWYQDKFTGKSMSRPGMKKLLSQVQAGDEVVVWRLDRLGRTAAGLHQIFEQLTTQKINFHSLRDALDLKTPSGRLVAGVLASVAAWETEVRGERVAAGMEVKRRKVAEGKDVWNVGRPRGSCSKRTPEVAAQIYRMTDDGLSVGEIARVLRLARNTIYSALRDRKAEPAR